MEVENSNQSSISLTGDDEFFSDVVFPIPDSFPDQTTSFSTTKQAASSHVNASKSLINITNTDTTSLINITNTDTTCTLKLHNVVGVDGAEPPAPKKCSVAHRKLQALITAGQMRGLPSPRIPIGDEIDLCKITVEKAKLNECDLWFRNKFGSRTLRRNPKSEFDYKEKEKYPMNKYTKVRKQLEEQLSERRREEMERRHRFYNADNELFDDENEEEEEEEEEENDFSDEEEEEPTLNDNAEPDEDDGEEDLTEESPFDASESVKQRRRKTRSPDDDGVGEWAKRNAFKRPKLDDENENPLEEDENGFSRTAAAAIRRREIDADMFSRSEPADDKSSSGNQIISCSGDNSHITLDLNAIGQSSASQDFNEALILCSGTFDSVDDSQNFKRKTDTSSQQQQRDAAAAAALNNASIVAQPGTPPLSPSSCLVRIDWDLRSSSSVSDDFHSNPSNDNSKSSALMKMDLASVNGAWTDARTAKSNSTTPHVLSKEEQSRSSSNSSSLRASAACALANASTRFTMSESEDSNLSLSSYGATRMGACAFFHAGTTSRAASSSAKNFESLNESLRASKNFSHENTAGEHAEEPMNFAGVFAEPGLSSEIISMAQASDKSSDSCEPMDDQSTEESTLLREQNENEEEASLDDEQATIPSGENAHQMYGNMDDDEEEEEKDDEENSNIIIQRRSRHTRRVSDSSSDEENDVETENDAAAAKCLNENDINKADKEDYFHTSASNSSRPNDVGGDAPKMTFNDELFTVEDENDDNTDAMSFAIHDYANANDEDGEDNMETDDEDASEVDVGVRPSKSIAIRDVLDDEASLSGDDVGSEHSGCESDSENEYDAEEGDNDELPDEEEIRENLVKQYMKQTNDEEERRMLRLQEQFFADSDLHGAKNMDRSFRFRMRNDANVDWSKILGKLEDDEKEKSDGDDDDDVVDASGGICAGNGGDLREKKVEMLKWKLEQEKKKSIYNSPSTIECLEIFSQSSLMKLGEKSIHDHRTDVHYSTTSIASYSNVEESNDASSLIALTHRDSLLRKAGGALRHVLKEANSDEIRPHSLFTAILQKK